MSARVTRLAVLLGLVLALTGVGAVLVLHFRAEGAPRLAVGDCVNLTNRAVVAVDCAATDSRYRVAKVVGSADARCPNGDYDWISEEHSRLSDQTLCLMPNAREGDCFAGGNGSKYAELSRIGCDGEWTVRVGRVIEGRSDRALCTAPQGFARVFAEPAATLCFLKP
ncbi:LppU/SCO3897 family protein [Streptoalloteichus hindustanus]|uniref:Uncharacterized protein n=1 Tax=Streptoalloteichus hindustanus TaxID=2017 RepID=A0A1M4WBL4_STRHI|nr:hypothetical protein [Streptoalloteichus hindustanus]SHE78616.1 hypothetical protein SAMN05444320_1011080 [Streptoalloteichus hindustanus]